MRKLTAAVALSALVLTGCGGGSSGGTGGGTVVLPTPTPTPTPSPSSATCSLANRQNFVLSTMNEWYLFPETLPANTAAGATETLDDYIDRLTATARSQGRDRFFTYLTSIAEENAFITSGSSAGFGVRLGTDSTSTRLFVVEAFEGAPALTAGIDRGDEIVAIGTSADNLRTINEIVSADQANGLSNALGPSDPGVTRVLRVSGASGVRNVTVTKADFNLIPVSSRYGAQIIEADGKKIGYLNLRTFIGSADDQLRNAAANFRAQGVTEFIIDLRYNGGGLVSTAEIFGDLLGGGRSSRDVFSQTRFRPSKSVNDDVHNFVPTSQSVSPTKIAFITSGGTASASELVINGMAPYLGSNIAIVGSNTFGKPVGQVAIDRAACDDRLRVVAFSTGNANNQFNYFDGLASLITNNCQAGDDFSFQLGDPREASVKQAIDFLGGRSCTPMASSQRSAAATREFAVGSRRTQLIAPIRPNAPQREVPGLF